jgi:hypothetical protein
VTLLRLLIRPVLVALLIGLVSVAVAVYLAFDRRPTVERAAEFTPDHIERAKRILESNDPRRMKTGTVRTVAVTAGDSDLALNYLAHRYAGGSAEAHFESGRLHVRGSVRASAHPWSPYVNVDVHFAEGAPFPAVEHIRVGQLPLPAAVGDAGLAWLLATVWGGEDLAVLRDAIKDVEFEEAGARLTYEWHDDLMDTVRAALIGPEDRERLRAYHQALVDVTGSLPPGPVSLTELLTYLFAVADERGRTSDPVTENRAAILVLAFYVDGRSIVDVLPEARSWPHAPGHAVTLNQRDDLSKHFMISAALSANTGGPFADAVGIYKEVADARGGSGFSFGDIAADRAGSRLGELAEKPESARRLQERLGMPLKEPALMPATSDLPEFMLEAEFKQEFGGVGAPAYARMMADIDERIAALPLYR